MKCQACQVPLELTHKVQAHPAANTQRAECPKCLVVYTLIQVLACEASSKGKGAHAVAKGLKDGTIDVVFTGLTD